MGDFKRLEVWILAKDLAVRIYKITNKDVFQKDFGLKDQIRRASVSISSNIAEGDESGTRKQSIRYFYIAKGSIAEVITQLTIAHDIGYISENEKRSLVEQCEIVSKKLYNLIEFRSNRKK